MTNITPIFDPAERRARDAVPVAPLHPRWGDEATRLFNAILAGQSEASRLAASVATRGVAVPTTLVVRMGQCGFRPQMIALQYYDVTPAELIAVLNDAIEAGEIDAPDLMA